MLIFAVSKSAAQSVTTIPFMPAWWKMAILLAVLLELAGVSFFIKRKWLDSQEAIPVSVALTLLFMVFSLYFLVSSILYWSSSPQERAPLLMWLVLFLIPLCVQYAMTLVNAISWQGSQRLSAIGTRIPEAPAITQAHMLLQEGKTEEAEQLLTEALKHRSRALEVMARWYRGEGEYETAAALYQEIMELATEDVDLCSEAAYNLGKLYESFLNKPYKTIALFQRITDEMPDSRYWSLAEADLTRLRMAFGESTTEEEEISTAMPSRQMDFWDRRRALLQRQSAPTEPEFKDENNPLRDDEE